MTEWLKSVTLLHGWIRPATYVVAALTVVTLWWFVTRKLAWWGQCLIATAGVTLPVVSWAVVDVWWHPIPDGIGTYVWAWVGVITISLLQALATPRSPQREGPRSLARRAVRLAARLSGTLVVLLCAMLAVNSHFSAYRSVADVLGLGIDRIAFDDVPVPRAEETTTHGQALENVWEPPAGMPHSGKVITTAIPSSDPTFAPRDAVIYLPPAYLTRNRPTLPVLVLLSGLPGEPSDWISRNHMVSTLETYAQQHNGLAPIVVVPDPLGNPTGNPLCSDAHLGNVATYLQQDVPAWIKQSFVVDPRPSRWAIGGFSNGGTCALQTITRAPNVYQSFLDMSGELHPTLGTEEETISTGFQGSKDAYLANDPLTLMATHRYPDVAGIFSVGTNDTEYGPFTDQLNAVAQQAGMSTEVRRYEGIHEYRVWAAALSDEIIWLGSRLGISSP